MSQDLPAALRHPTRLAALRQLGLLDTAASPAFDRLASLAARVLHAPIALIALVDAERQFFKSAVGLPEPWAAQRETPLLDYFCQYVVVSGQPLIIADAREHPLLHDNLAISDLGFMAYAGMPLITAKGQRLGSFCVVDHVPRTWSEAELEILRDLSASVIAEIELLADNIEHTQAEETAQRLAAQRKRLLEVAQIVVSSLAIDEILPQLQRTLQIVVAHKALSIYWLDAAAGLLRPAHLASSPWLGDQVSSWPIPIGSGIAGAVAQSGRAEMVNNAHLDPRSIYPPGTPHPPAHHLIGIPIKLNEQMRGVFLISRTSSQPFTEQEFELAQIFTGFASLAIENARLFEQTKLVEEHQRLLLAQIPCLLWTTDRELHFTSSVGIDLRGLGMPPEAVVGMSLFEFFQTDDPAALAIAAHRQALDGESSTYELEWRGRIFQSCVEPFVDSQGQVTGCIGVALDITERRQIDEALREEFAFRTAIIERAAEGLCVCHEIAEYPYVAFTVWNDRMTEITGYTIEEINRLGWYQTIYAEPDLQACAQARMAQMRAGHDLIAEEWEITRADGQKRVVAFSTSVLSTTDGSTHVLALLHDITQRKRAEEALREGEERYRSFFERSIDGILLTAPDGRIFAANPAACQIFGRSEEEICQVGRAGVIDTADARLPAALEERAQTGMFKGELTFLRKDGTLFPGELSTALFKDRDGHIKTSMIVRDITERKHADHEREQLIAALQEALASIKTLRGLLPICASCKRIRDDSGYWSQIEAYVQAHSDAIFSHGICPDCARQLYAEFLEE